jgi:hypothetical protein
MLFEGRKFHLRTYFLIATINGKYKTHFYDLYELFTAEKQYNNNDFLDKDIHDTHFKSTPRDIQCPYDLEPELQKIFEDELKNLEQQRGYSIKRTTPIEPPRDSKVSESYSSSRLL